MVRTSVSSTAPILSPGRFEKRAQVRKFDGTDLGHETCMFLRASARGIMEGNPDWPALLTAHLGALQEFERITKALTAAVIERNSAAADLRQLFAAESMARYAVILSRIRLVNANDSQPGFQLPITPGNLDKRV